MLAVIMVIGPIQDATVRADPRRQRGHRHRPGGAGQADARPARGAERARGAVSCATVTSQEIAVEAVVLDDLLELRAGDQIPCDGVVRVADGLEVDESLLTGESDPVDKADGDEVLSGSFVVAGSGRFQATRSAPTPTRPSWPPRPAGSSSPAPS